MTLAARGEERWLGRPRKRRAADTAVSLAGIDVSARAAAAVDRIVHWGYGTALGALRGAAIGAGAAEGVATAAHFAVAWGPWRVALRRTGVDRQRPDNRRELAIDAGNHAVYAAVTAWASKALTLREGARYRR